MSDRETLAYLASERARHPELAESIDLHSAILRARTGIEPAVPEIDEPEARARLARGEPLLRPDGLAIDWDALAHLFWNICEITAQHRPDQAPVLLDLSARGSTPEAVVEMARAYLRGACDDSLAAFVLNNALHPFLSATARAAQARVDNGKWYRGTCPVCGGVPDLAAYEKESGARRLLCSQCDFEWLFHRLVCPFCAAEEGQGYFSGGQGAYRLYTCDACRRYLKTVDARDLVREVHLPAERILTLGMDVAALAAGYHA